MEMIMLYKLVGVGFILYILIKITAGVLANSKAVDCTEEDGMTRLVYFRYFWYLLPTIKVVNINVDCAIPTEGDLEERVGELLPEYDEKIIVLQVLMLEVGSTNGLMLIHRDSDGVVHQTDFMEYAQYVYDVWNMLIECSLDLLQEELNTINKGE
jgi:hypothetical protein